MSRRTSSDDLTDDARCRRSAADLEPNNDRHVAWRCRYGRLAALHVSTSPPSSPTSAGGSVSRVFAVALLVHTLAPLASVACTGKIRGAGGDFASAAPAELVPLSCGAKVEPDASRPAIRKMPCMNVAGHALSIHLQSKAGTE